MNKKALIYLFSLKFIKLTDVEVFEYQLFTYKVLSYYKN